MLLPSDVARLVLGYLQQEKLSATCREFILESSDLKEYAEHCTEDGSVPACLLSLFGKNLTTILNEYVAMKTKETTIEVPAMMSSLWKKLDYTLSQIRSMQNSAGFSAHQRSRTRSGIVDMKRQKMLQQGATPVLGLLSVVPQSGHHNSSTVANTHVIHRPIINQNVTQTRLFASQTQENKISRDSIHIQVPGPQERKLHSSILSPARRKSIIFLKCFSDSQKRKSVTSPAPHSQSKNCQESVEMIAEEESEPLQELIDGNFPQLVIENAREKILSNKSLQEKLAENINKFLGSDGSVTQAPKQTDSGLAEQESAIDEILGLQGEIHMSEEAIQDILEQTESDPAFQALFDLFDYGKNKTNKNLPHGVSSQSGVESTVVGEENNLNTLESSLETEEVRDNSTGALSCKDYHPEEAVCTLKNSSSDSGDTGQKSVTSEQLPRSSKPKKQTETLKTVTDEQIGELEIAFESVPDLTESNKKQSSGTRCNEHCVDSYSNKEAAELVSESETAMETEKDPQSHNAQNRPGLEYDHSETPQSSLPSLDEDTVTSENRMYSVHECHLSPDTSLSEKLNSKSSHRSPGHSVMPKKINASISNQSADSGKNEQDVSKDIPMLPVVLQQNSNHHSSCQEQDKRSDCGENSMVNLLDPKKTELQLEVVDTSNKPYSGDQHTLKSCTKDLNLHSESSNSEKTQVEMQEPSSSTKADADTVTFSSGDDSCAEISVVSTESNPAIVETCRSPPGTASSTDEPSTELKRIGGVSSSSQPMDVDPANIMSLKIIISDDPFISSDSELNSAVNSITGENLPTIVLSSPTKSPAKTTGPSKCLTSEEIERSEDSALVEQNLLVLRPKDPVISTVGTKNEDCTVLTVAGTTNIAKDGGFIQLLPTTSTAFGNSNNLYIATCVTDPTVLGTTVTPSNVVVFPGNSMPLAAQAPAAQQLRTPPRSSSTFATSQAMSPNFSQGSAIIIASPVQPVLQGMVGMIPISVVGQNGNTFSAPSHQVLHVPFSNPVCNRSVPKLPIPPKAQKTTGARSKSNIGKPASSTAEPLSHPSSRIQRTGNSDRNVSSDQGRKLEETSLTAVGETTSSNSKQNESHRRVLCFDSALPAPGGNTQAQAMSSSQKEKSENSLFAVDSPSATSASLKIQPSKREKEKTLPRILCKPEISSNRGAVVKEAQPERKALASGVGLESFHKTTANKENELRRDTDDKQNNQEVAKLSNGQQNTGLRNEKTATSVQDVNKKTGTLSNGSSKSSGTVSQSSKEPKQDQAKSSSQGLCLASPLTKQAVEMLHDIQWNSPASKVVENGDLPVPRTPSGVGDRHTDDTTDSIRTPTCRRYNEDSTTPRIMVPPATPDLPACSPTSETGSENSVSMAAHTLMILSRAAIARTSTTTPLKDNTQQFRSLRSTGKKRKLEDLNEGERLSRSASRKDLQSSTTPMKKKKIKKKKLPNSFPAGMDVDKFLLSLHYDE
ncbi:protein NPAT isoform X2 [Alligator mississippiensis]|uniref:protein NPAT isoform X2 n=1 Tax=Alligator mississippiensis TaxID=8496 RepID=UPI00287744CC|nr:protein NPAT isoform X2 [Alligator mississippiensis]